MLESRHFLTSRCLRGLEHVNPARGSKCFPLGYEVLQDTLWSACILLKVDWPRGIAMREAGSMLGSFLSAEDYWGQGQERRTGFPDAP